MPKAIHSCSRRACGFTLIEALVALLVLSIGLLGIATLQLSSLRWNQGASQRSQATLLAYDILDRMRANKNNAANGDYDTVIGQSETATGTVAERDLTAWKKNLQDTLPDGDGEVGSVATANAAVPGGWVRIFTITIQWDDRHSTDPGVADVDAQATKFTMVSEL